MSTRGNTFLNAVVGAVVTVVLSFLPLAPTLGSGVAGYLHGGGLRDGAKVGGVAGLFAMVPIFVTLLFAVPVFVIAPFGVPNMPVSALGFAIGLFWFVGLYTVGLGILGGVIGAYLAQADQD